MSTPGNDPYLVERVRDRLAVDDRVGELGLVLRLMSGRLFITGSVPTEECRRAITEIVADAAGTVVIVNETVITPAPSPGTDHEVLQ